MPPRGIGGAVQLRVGHLAQEAGAAEEPGNERLRFQANAELPEAALDVPPVDKQARGGQSWPVKGLVQGAHLGAVRQRRRVGQGTRIPDDRAGASAAGAGRGLQPCRRSRPLHHEDHFVVATGDLVAVRAQHVGRGGVGRETAALEPGRRRRSSPHRRAPRKPEPAVRPASAGPARRAPGWAWSGEEEPYP